MKAKEQHNHKAKVVGPVYRKKSLGFYTNSKGSLVVLLETTELIGYGMYQVLALVVFL